MPKEYQQEELLRAIANKFGPWFIKYVKFVYSSASSSVINNTCRCLQVVAVNVFVYIGCGAFNNWH